MAKSAAATDNSELMPEVNVESPSRWSRYRADITAGSLKLAESRVVADLLLSGADQDAWKQAVGPENRLQTRSPATARRLARLIRNRLETMGPELWLLVRDGKGDVATHAVLAATVKHSQLLADFLIMVVGEQYRRFSTTLARPLWDEFLDGCRERDPAMPQWPDSTRRRLRSSVYQILAQAGYIESTRKPTLRTVHIADQVLSYLKANKQDRVLRCIQVAP